MDYPLGLRSQGPAFKSPSGRFRAKKAMSDSEEPVRPKTARRDLSTIDAARPKGATVYRPFKSPFGRSLRSHPNEAHARFARVNRRPDAPFGRARTSPTLAAARVGRRSVGPICRWTRRCPTSVTPFASRAATRLLTSPRGVSPTPTARCRSRCGVGKNGRTAVHASGSEREPRPGATEGSVRTAI